MLRIEPILLLKDNYAYFLEDLETKVTAIVDPSESESVLEFLERTKTRLHFILNTHHHHDHTGGNEVLKKKTGARVVGFEGDRHRIPAIDICISSDGTFLLGRSEARILHVPGHTLGAIAFYFSSAQAVFTGDTLFSLGCGRLFEGSPEIMWKSLQKLKALPDSTKVYFGHEYTAANLKFALTLDPENNALKELGAEIQKRRPTTPSDLKLEKALNPFLQANPKFQSQGEAISDFARIRKLKDSF